MNPSIRRVRGLIRKELREFRRNRSLIAGVAIFPLIYLVQPLITALRLETSTSGAIAHEHVLLYMLGIPLLVPVILASSSIAGEREQGTLEPALTTPVRRNELVLGKALAAFLPSLVVSYVVYAVFILVVRLLAQPGIAAALLRWQDIVAQVFFTPLLAIWSIWVSMGISARSRDIRVAYSFSMLASLPPIFLVVAIALGAIPPTAALAFASAAGVAVLDTIGWRITSRLLNRERLIVGRVTSHG